MPEETLFQGEDHAGRSWLVTARPGQTGNPLRPATIVTFFCRSSRGTKQLDQTAAWDPIERWDIQRWFPFSPRPVPEKVLQAVEKRLKEVAA